MSVEQARIVIIEECLADYFSDKNYDIDVADIREMAKDIAEITEGVDFGLAEEATYAVSYQGCESRKIEFGQDLTKYRCYHCRYEGYDFPPHKDDRWNTPLCPNCRSEGYAIKHEYSKSIELCPQCLRNNGL